MTYVFFNTRPYLNFFCAPSVPLFLYFMKPLIKVTDYDVSIILQVR